MKEIKLLATDMDGTLLNDNKEISRYNLRALRKLHQQGVEIVVCSGRNYTGVISYLKEIGEDIVNHIVFCNGAGIYDVKKDRVIKKQLLNEEFVQLAVKLGNRLEIPCTWINGKMVKTTVNPIPRYLLQEAYLTDMDWK